MQTEPTILFRSKPYKVSKKANRNLLRVRVPVEGERVELTASTLKSLQEKADELHQSSRTDTLGWYVEHVWIHTRLHIRQETTNKDRWALAKFILPEFDHVPLDEITRPMVQQAFNRWAKDYSPGSLSIFRNKLANILNYARRDGYIQINPCDGLRLPHLPEARGSALSKEDVFDAINHPEIGFRSMARLLSLGLRAGEASGLTRNHIKDGTLVIEQQRHNREVSMLKTRQSKRILPIPHSLEKAILADAGDVYLANTAEGFPPGHNQPWRTAQAVNKKAGAHDFRRFFSETLAHELLAPHSVHEYLMGHKVPTYLMPKVDVLRGFMEQYWEMVSTSVPNQFGEQEGGTASNAG